MRHTAIPSNGRNLGKIHRSMTEVSGPRSDDLAKCKLKDTLLPANEHIKHIQ